MPARIDRGPICRACHNMSRGAPLASRTAAAAVGWSFRAQNARYLSLRATPSTTSPSLSASSEGVSGASADARFEVVGAPYSLLSASLSPSQALHTRRGTLVGLTGKPDNAVSTLKVLGPLRRLPLRIPFLYQRIISTTPTTALIATKSPNTSFTVLNLNGTVDWMIAQRDALLAWTGHSLAVKPTVNTKLSVAHWGNTKVTGRGLIALVGRGQVYSIDLKAGEQFITHPSNIVAYTLTNATSPLPYRFKSSTWTLSTPTFGLGTYLLSTNLFRNLSASDTWKTLSTLSHRLRTFSRRTIFGDRLFLEFKGPATLLLQTRAAPLSESLSNANVNEIVDSAGRAGVENAPLSTAVGEAETEAMRSEGAEKGKDQTRPSLSEAAKPTGVFVASVGRDGKVGFEAVEKKEKV